MSKLQEGRFPIEPVLALYADRTNRELAAIMGITIPALRAYKYRGLPWHVADRLAVQAGSHPAILWPDWVEAALAAA